MKAIVNQQYGSPDVLQLKEIGKPAPKDNEVLVEVQAASVNAADWHLLTADIFLVRLMSGLLKPKVTVLGGDVAGRVAAVGRYVKQLKPGDEVFGCAANFGCLAEYVYVPEIELALKPTHLTWAEAAAVPMAAITALQGLRDKGQVRPGQKVLIHGASGGVGTFAVQLAKYLGAEVTAVCSTKNVETARALGAGRVIDYTKENFTQNEQHYDMFFAANGNRSIFDYRRALNPNGIYIMAGGSSVQIFQAMLLGPWISMTGSKKMGSISAALNQKDLLFIRELLEAGKIKPVIDRCYPLSETAAALRYLGEGHARGKVIITMED